MRQRKNRANYFCFQKSKNGTKTTNMAIANIRKKYITYARNLARGKSTARTDGRSIYFKRYAGKRYHIIMVHVTEKQRALRDMFAEANKLAKADMTRWNRVRHWERYARKHKKLGAYRAAVSFYYKMIREQGNKLKEIKREERAYSADIRVFRVGNLFCWLKNECEEEMKEDVFLLAG